MNARQFRYLQKLTTTALIYLYCVCELYFEVISFFKQFPHTVTPFVDVRSEGRIFGNCFETQYIIVLFPLIVTELSTLFLGHCVVLGVIYKISSVIAWHLMHEHFKT